MLQRATWCAVAIATAVTAIGGCGGGPTPTGDAGTRDASDRCRGLTPCATVGASCAGTDLVTCAANADGCLVASTRSCSAEGATCIGASPTATCSTDPCAAIPASDRCDTASRTCDGPTLDVCEADADGCMVRTRTVCAAVPGGVCDATGAMPMCVLPPDPCAAIPAETRCETAGTSCEGESLVTCAPDAFGCLVRSTADCASRAGGSCDEAASPIACAFADDPCADVAECATLGAWCEGPELVRCERDAFGCAVEARTACTDTMFGFCAAAPSGRASCSTAAVDPCMGVTECGDAPGRSCRERTLEVCAPNPFGCFVTTETDCTVTGEICDDTRGVAVCGDPCEGLIECGAALSCDDNAVVTCAPNANGCLIETAREVCEGATCIESSDGAECAPSCASALETVLDCDSGTITGNTSSGGSTVLDGYACAPPTYTRGEHIYRFVNPSAAHVEIAIRRTSGSADYDLFVLDGGDGSADCNAETPCLASAQTGSETEMVELDVAAGQVVYVSYDLFGTIGTAGAAYELTIDCLEPMCGDGDVEAPEACDDGETEAGDGCSPTCALEPGYVCSGAPSTCEIACGNGAVDRVAAEQCDDGGTSADDGCSATCVIEPGYSCTGAPSICVLSCGDGVIDFFGGEECDDGGSEDDDGCSATCAVEAGYRCSGEPSTCLEQAAHATCAGAIALGTSGARSGDDLRAGGDGPIGPTCGFGGGPSLYYTVTIPARSVSTLTATSEAGGDLAIRVLQTCASDDCLSMVDAPGGEPEVIAITNPSDASITRIVVISAFESGFPGGPTGVGPFDLALTNGPIAFEAIPAACVDTAAGTALDVEGDDDVSPIASLPFSFTSFGTARTRYSVSSNGFVQLYGATGGTALPAYENSTIPSAIDPDGVVAAFWDDLVVEPGVGSVRTITTGTAPSRRFVVEWQDVRVYGADSDGTSLRFQAHLLEGTNVVELHYCEASDASARLTGSGATIGVEGASGTTGVLVSFNQSGAAVVGGGYRISP